MGRLTLAVLPFLVGGAGLGCAADDPPSAFGETALLLRATLGPDGATGVEAIALLPRTDLGDLEPGAQGAVHVLAVDPVRGVSLGEGRLPYDRTVTVETFHPIGIEGIPVQMAAVEQYFVVRSSASGLVRVTLRLDTEAGERVRAYELDVSGAPGPVTGREVDPVDADGSAVGMLRAAATDPGVGSGEGLVSDETCGDGMVDMDDGTGFFSFIAQLFDEQCDDGNTEDGDGCSADCRNEMVHLAGSTDVNATYAVLFIPAGWGDLAAFEAYAKSTAEGALAQDWYDEHTEEISFWALVDQEVDDLGRVPCAGPMDTPTQAHADAVWDRVDEVAFPEAVLARYEGALGIVDTHVVTHPVDCRNWTTFGGRAISLGLSERADVVMAHEIGHNLGWLDDEYAYGSCRPPRAPNTSIEDPIKWSCLAQNNGGAACPEGAPVHAYPVEGAGCDILRPCRTCMMLNYADFCPVCRAQMDARIVGGVAEIASNGADDDLDGDTDDGGCDCTPNSCPAMGCGGDGCFGECGCGAGQRCFAGACEDSCPGQTCGIDDIGHEVCDGDVYIYRGECPEGQALRCRCDAAGFALVDCSGCAG